MKFFDVYPKYPITIQKAEGSYLWDLDGNKYLDFYGGHAVISIGHSHPHYIRRVSQQLERIGFYSNAINISQQEELADLLADLSGYKDHQLFLCNSGAEANENAFKIAGFHTGRRKIIVFENGFHGRTSLAVAATDNKKLVSPLNETNAIIRLPLNDQHVLSQHMSEDIAAVCVEGIQGIAGVYEPTTEFLLHISEQCRKYGTLLILDEIQSGYGRSGKFFAHQYARIQPDIITVAKGMGNGFPMGGVLIAQHIKPWHGMLGTTFGGNHLACAAGIAVLEVLRTENLLNNAIEKGERLKAELSTLQGVRQVRGKGLMIGVEMYTEVKQLRHQMLLKHKVFTGSSTHPNTLRLLPSLAISDNEVDFFLDSFKSMIEDEELPVPT